LNPHPPKEQASLHSQEPTHEIAREIIGSGERANISREIHVDTRFGIRKRMHRSGGGENHAARLEEMVF
jgi:hypothetical protein